MNIWITLTPEDITHYLASPQLQALRQFSDPLLEIIADIIAKVRSEISAFPANALSHDRNCIPKALRSDACHLIIEALQSRIPTLKLTPDQIRNANNARTYLKRIAKGEIPLPPLLRKAPIEIAHCRKSTANGNALKGL